jgi:hypothetical protein
MAPMSGEAALASNLFDVATQPKCQETMIIDHSLACLSPAPSTFFLNPPTLWPFYPQPAA